MAIDHFAINAVDRSAEQQGKGASRRLRKQNLVPAIIYGGNEEPTAISIKLNEMVKSLEYEAFFSQVLTITTDKGDEHQVVIKDLQRHPAKGFPMHADFQRIVKGQKINMNVPVHFSGREDAPGTKKAVFYQRLSLISKSLRYLHSFLNTSKLMYQVWKSAICSVYQISICLKA